LRLGRVMLMSVLAASTVVSGCGGARAARVETETVYSGGKWESRTVEADGQTYPVGVWIPDGWEGDGRGLVFLHGMGECGTDGTKQLTVGLPPKVDADPRRWPFVVIAPQKPTAQSQWGDHAAAVFKALDEVVAEGLVDPDRVAITGLSQGGHGTMRIGAMAPERFRAAAPVCGYISAPQRERFDGLWTNPDDPEVREVARSLAQIPVWIFHGGRDNVVPPGESRLLDRLIRAEGGAVELTIFPEDNHNSWDSAYGDSGLGAWLIRLTK